MKFKPQFRLRTLLKGISAVCLVLGAWHFYYVCFGPYVEAEPATTTGSVMVRGRFFDFGSFDFATNSIRISKLLPNGRRFAVLWGDGRAARSWLWVYDFNVSLGTIPEEGRYDIELRPLTTAVRWRGGPTPADSIWGKMVVELDRPTGERMLARFHPMSAASK